MSDKFRFTKTRIEALGPADPGKRRFHYDADTPGLSVQVTASGTKTFYVYRWVSSKPEKIRLGTFPAMTVEQAQRETKKVLGTIAEGKSPAAEKRAIKAESVTLKEAFAEYLEARDLKPGTVHDYKRHMVESFSDWQDQRLTEITRDMVERRHAKLGERSEARANGAMRVLRAILNFAAGKYETASGQPIILDIPTKRLSATRRWYRVERRQTLNKPAQLPAWWSAVEALESETIRDYLNVLILTGLRRGECARLEWKDIDLEGRTLTAPDTKNRNPHTLPLSSYLVELFRRRSKASDGSRFVIPVGPRRANKDKDGHLNDARHSMNAVESSRLPTNVSSIP